LNLPDFSPVSYENTQLIRSRNTSPTASPPNNFIGWVCIVGGDNPKWHKFGAIESTPDTTVASMTLTSDELVEATFNQNE
jgi:hypothetical protein